MNQLQSFLKYLANEAPSLFPQIVSHLGDWASKTPGAAVPSMEEIRLLDPKSVDSKIDAEINTKFPKLRETGDGYGRRQKQR